MVDAELFVLPSHQENFGIAVVEAMACGIPVVVSDRVNIVREIEAAGAGRASPVEEPALTEVLQSLLADQSLRSAMGARGRDLVLQRFTWDRIVSRVLQVYEQILAGADPRRPSSILHH
jgi:glycosyltransferase involved in cell wall biosynthesis